MRVSTDLLQGRAGPLGSRGIYRAAAGMARLWRDRT